MKFKKIKIVILFVLLCVTRFSEAINTSSSKIKLVTDAVISVDRATFVTGKLCWSLDEMFDLSARLAETESPKSLRFIDHFQTPPDLTHHELIIVDLGCPDTEDFLKKGANLGLFQSPHRWLMLTGPGNSTETYQLDYINVLLDSYVILADRMSDQVDLSLVYKINSKSRLLSQPFGTWTSRYGLRKSQAMAIPTWLRRKNLENMTLTISLVAVNKETETNLHDIRNPDDGTTKLGYRMLTTLFNFINATDKFIFTETVGNNVNGSWNGMIGHVWNGQAEITGAGMVISGQRIMVMNYLIDPFETTIKFVFRQPSLSYQNNIFVLPFTGSVWLCFGGMIIIVLFVLYVHAKWEHEKSKITDKNTMHTTSSTLMSDMMMMVSSMISQQGSSIELTGSVGRLVMTTVFISFMFLFVSYSANIVALLQASSSSIRTLADLAHSKLELGAEDAVYNRFLFKDVSDPVKKAIHDKIYKSEFNFMPFEDGVRRMQKTPFAFHMLTGAGYRIVERLFNEHEKCGLQEISFLTTFQKPWITVKKGSPYTDLLKIGLYRLRENGVSDRENKVLFSSKPKCESQGGSFNSVTIVDVYPAMLLLLYGAIMAFALLVAEILVHRSQMGKSKTINLARAS